MDTNRAEYAHSKTRCGSPNAMPRIEAMRVRYKRDLMHVLWVVVAKEVDKLIQFPVKAQLLCQTNAIRSVRVLGILPVFYLVLTTRFLVALERKAQAQADTIALVLPLVCLLMNRRKTKQKQTKTKNKKRLLWLLVFFFFGFFSFFSWAADSISKNHLFTKIDIKESRNYTILLQTG
jgi:hypothetical protein